MLHYKPVIRITSKAELLLSRRGWSTVAVILDCISEYSAASSLYSVSSLWRSQMSPLTPPDLLVWFVLVEVTKGSETGRDFRDAEHHTGLEQKAPGPGRAR